MGRPTWRWGVVAGLLALLVALPSLAQVLPASADAPADLLRRVQRSQGVAWSGLGESTGALALPDVRELSGLPELLGATTRTRVWWRGAKAYRVDAVRPTGETDVVVDRAGSWTWDSADRRAVRLTGRSAVRLPTGADLAAPLLGRRLARTPGLVASPLPGRRVAGRRTAGLRLVPPAASATTVASVDLWAEPRTGLPLRVEVHARGLARPVVVAELLDLTLSRPPLVRVAFAPPQDAQVQFVDAPDLAASIDRFAPYLLPGTLGGQPRANAPGGVGLYGTGLATFAVLPLPNDVGRRALRAVDPTDTDGRAALSTPLLNALVLRDRRRVYLIAGTVPAAVLDSAGAQLLADRPPYVGPR